MYWIMLASAFGICCLSGLITGSTSALLNTDKVTAEIAHRITIIGRIVGYIGLIALGLLSIPFVVKLLFYIMDLLSWNRSLTQ